MAAVLERALATPPTAYEDWLSCFDYLKSSTSVDNMTVMTITRGSFVSRGYIAVQFHQKLADTINEMLNKRISKFSKDLNMLISFNELSDIVPLFIRLRNDVEFCLFFMKFDFLDKGIKGELEQSVKAQMEKFWNDTVAFLQRQTMEFSNSDLEDSLFLIRRLKLFAKAG